MCRQDTHFQKIWPVSRKAIFLFLINNTNNKIFLHISPDSYPFRGVTLPPGKYAFCICALSFFFKATKSIGQLRISLAPRNFDVHPNYKIKCEYKNHGVVEVYTIDYLTEEVSSLAILASARIPTLNRLMKGIPQYVTERFYCRKFFAVFRFWECRFLKHEVYHHWVVTPACTCDPEFQDQCDDTYNRRPFYPSFFEDFPHLYSDNLLECQQIFEQRQKDKKNGRES